jgi:hypothetical protein
MAWREQTRIPRVQRSMKQETNTELHPDHHADNAQKDPDTWSTGDETMTGAQASYLKTLSEEAGEPMDESLSKAEASKRITELRDKTGRGKDH